MPEPIAGYSPGQDQDQEASNGPAVLSCGSVEADHARTAQTRTLRLVETGTMAGMHDRPMGGTFMSIFKNTVSALALVLSVAALGPTAARAADWDIAKAAAPYKGTELHVIFLDRPGYRAIIKLLPEFEKQTASRSATRSFPTRTRAKRKCSTSTARAIFRLRWSISFGSASSPRMAGSSPSTSFRAMRRSPTLT